VVKRRGSRLPREGYLSNDRLREAIRELPSEIWNRFVGEIAAVRSETDHLFEQLATVGTNIDHV
jgi:hypothetical protein